MGLFAAIRRWVSGLFGLNQQNIREAFGVDRIAISAEMLRLQELYRQIVRGAAPWNNADTPSIRLAGAISSEIAQKVVVGLESEIEGSARADYLNEQYTKVKDDLRTAVIAACNGGEIIFKPYMLEGGLAVSIAETEGYWPVEYNTRDELIDVVFGAALQRGRYTYKLLERHRFDEAAQAHEITYRAYRSEDSSLNYAQGNTPSFTAGNPVPLTEVPEWAHLEDMRIAPINQPLFAHFKIPTSDIVESPQRQGLPVWSKAVDKLREADEQNRYTRREYYLGRARILASVDLFGASNTSGSKRDENGSKPRNGPPLTFAPDDKDIFVKLNDDPNMVPITIFNPDFRFDGLNAEMNRIKRDIELLSGLSYGIISDAAMADKTATEVRASKDRFFTTVSDIQQAAQKALEHLIASFDVLADLQRIPHGSYDVSFTWDDSIIADRAVEFEERMKMLREGILSLPEMRAWYFGVDVDSEEAQNVPAVKSEFE